MFEPDERERALIWWRVYYKWSSHERDSLRCFQMTGVMPSQHTPRATRKMRDEKWKRKTKRKENGVVRKTKRDANCRPSFATMPVYTSTLLLLLPETFLPSLYRLLSQICHAACSCWPHLRETYPAQPSCLMLPFSLFALPAMPACYSVWDVFIIRDY